MPTKPRISAFKQSLHQLIFKEWYPPSHDTQAHKMSWLKRGSRCILRHLFLKPLSLITHFYIRRKYAHPMQRSAYRAPIIVVGNITVGGNGKTPFVAALARYLASQGWNVGIICRGDGGMHLAEARAVDSTTSSTYGDEARLHAQLGYPVWQGRFRHHVAQALLAAHPDVNVLISDDGLQHQPLHRDISIGLIHAERGLGNAKLLPAGPLREPIEQLYALDALIIHHTQRSDTLHPSLKSIVEQCNRHTESAPRCFDSYLDISTPYPLHPSNTYPSNANSTYAALTAIAHPESFFTSLKQAAIHIDDYFSFPDHYRINEDDVKALKQYQAVFITEKDAVKCHDFPHIAWWVVPSATRLPDTFKAFISDALQKTLAKSKNNH